MVTLRFEFEIGECAKSPRSFDRSSYPTNACPLYLMTTCTYCGETVPPDRYERHLRHAHAAELTAIDRRRVRTLSAESSRRSPLVYAGVGLLLVLFAVGYVSVFLLSGTGTSSAAVQPDASMAIHEHGTIVVQYDDTVVDFTDAQYIERDGCFHFHAYDDAEVWHVHCEDVTIEYALETLGMTVTADRFAVDDREFSEEDGDSVTVTVDGEVVDPQEYVLDGVESVDDAMDGAGDHVEIVVESAD